MPAEPNFDRFGHRLAGLQISNEKDYAEHRRKKWFKALEQLPRGATHVTKITPARLGEFQRHFINQVSYQMNVAELRVFYMDRARVHALDGVVTAAEGIPAPMRPPDRQGQAYSHAEKLLLLRHVAQSDELRMAAFCST